MFKKYKEQIKQLQEQNNELNTKLEETNKQLSIEKSARASLSNTLQSMQIKYREDYELDRIKEDIEKVVREKYDENAEFDYDTVDENWLISKDC